jgi:hypothetical protein
LSWFTWEIRQQIIYDKTRREFDIGLEIPEDSRDSVSEVIIGISRAEEALINGAFILSLFPAIKYGNIKALIILDC